MVSAGEGPSVGFGTTVSGVTRGTRNIAAPAPGPVRGRVAPPPPVRVGAGTTERRDLGLCTSPNDSSRTSGTHIILELQPSMLPRQVSYHQSNMMHYITNDSHFYCQPATSGQSPPHHPQHLASQQPPYPPHEGEGKVPEGQGSQSTAGPPIDSIEMAELQPLALLGNPFLIEPRSSRWRRDAVERRTPVALRVPYPYADDLRALESYRRQVVPAQLQAIVTPLKWQAWEVALSSHPTPEFGKYIARGIREGFRVGFNGMVSCRPSGANMPSTTQHPGPVEEFLQGECEALHMQISGKHTSEL